MSERLIGEVIDAHPVFKDLPPGAVKRLVDSAYDVHFSYGEYIFREGEKAERFFLIRHGIVAVENQTEEIEPVTIQSLGKGDLLGWSWIFPPHIWNFDARAIEHTNAIAFNAEDVRALMKEDPEFGLELVMRFSSIMIDRLRAAQRQLLGLFGAFQRVQAGS